MDLQQTYASRDDLWRLQNDMKSVFAMQAEHADRILRLERRQDDDSRLKSVWGTSSPFPNVLGGGTPQQDPAYNPAAEAFKSFDLDQSSTLLGNLHLEADEEPRRGASRANSVRFDETALQGHFGHASRASSDFFPIRTGSGMSSHPMTERSSSHKSDGRQSSAGQSTHSTRLNSLGFDARPPVLNDTVISSGPPPGLFHLGPLPCIIRCWLDENFSNESLLYAAVCSGSYRSLLSFRLLQRLGFEKRMVTSDGRRTAKLQVWLPEATIQQSSPRSVSPAPQLPVLTVEFTILDVEQDIDTIQIYLGSDVLRTNSAEILFSQDRMTIYDDEWNKLAVPLVRPEHASVFQNLLTINTAAGNSAHLPLADPSHATAEPIDDNQEAEERSYPFQRNGNSQLYDEARIEPDFVDIDRVPRSTVQFMPEHGRLSVDPESDEGSRSEAKPLSSDDLFPASIKPEHGSVSGSWRRESLVTRPESTFSSVASSASFQRPGRGRGMKILKPARSSTSRSISAAQTSDSSETVPNRETELAPSRAKSIGEGGGSQAANLLGRSSSLDAKAPLMPLSTKSRLANPVGGASAFGWLNASSPES